MAVVKMVLSYTKKVLYNKMMEFFCFFSVKVFLCEGIFMRRCFFFKGPFLFDRAVLKNGALKINVRYGTRYK